MEEINLRKLEVHFNKSLKLSNVLIKRLDSEEEIIEFDKVVQLMNDYIKSKGAMPVGPLIQYTSPIVNEAGEADIVMELMMQSNNYLHHVELPYQMKPTIKVKDCLYSRFAGDESRMHIMYDKINVTAYEEEIELKGSTYTIFVDKKEENIIVDVFMEKED